MEKIINVAVSGSELEQSTNFGGIQGEGGARYLKISFDEEWSAYSKSVTFLDANLENPVKILLTTANLDADGTYLVAIPKTALLTGGKLTYIIEGVSDGVLQRSVSKELKVKYAPEIDADDLVGVITPTEADQLNLSIQNEAERIDALFESKADLEESFSGLSERVDKQLLAKADISYVEDALLKKADSSDMEIELSKKCDISYVDDALSKKCDTSYVAENLANKANATDVAIELSKKADKTDVAKELSKKADSTYVEYVEEELSKKADSAFVEKEILKKADRSYVEEEISALDIRLSQQEEYIAEKTDEMFERNDVVANAVKGELSGAVVCIDDVSPVEHEMDVEVEVKNLIPYPYLMGTQTINGVTFTVNDDGTVVANGTATKATYFALWYAESKKMGVYKGERYTLSGCPAGGGSSTYQIACQSTDTTTINLWDKGEGASAVALADDFVKVVIYIANGATLNSVEFKPMLSLSADTEYTPYVNLSTVNIIRSGKNLIPYPYFVETQTINGVNFTVNDDGAVVADGTATANTYFALWSVENKKVGVYKGKRYTLSGCPAGGGSSTYQIACQTNDNSVINLWDKGEGATAVALADGFVKILIYISKGATLNNVEFKPMLSLSTDTEYEQGLEKIEYTPNADGTVEGITSLSPTTSLIADKEGVDIKVTYNKDINKVIEQLTNAIISLGGNI